MPLPSARGEPVREEPEVDRFRAMAAELENDEGQQDDDEQTRASQEDTTGARNRWRRLAHAAETVGIAGVCQP